METVTLQSSNGPSFVTEMAVARFIGTVRTMLDAGVVAAPDGAAGVVVPLPKVTGDILELVLKWARYHHDRNEDDEHDGGFVDEPADDNYHNDAFDGDREAAELRRRARVIGAWDQDFLRPLNRDMLFGLCGASHYLDMPQLLQLTTWSVASMIRGKSVRELRALFGVAELVAPGADEGIVV